MVRRVVLLCVLMVAGWATRGSAAADSQSLRVTVHIGPRVHRGTPAAETQLRRIVVNGEAAQVQDLFPTAAGQLSERELGGAVITGLRPGERRTLAGGEIALRLGEVGVDAGKRALAISGGVVVERAAQVVPADTVLGAGAEAISAELALRPAEEATITPVTEARPMLAPVGMLRVEATARRPALQGGLWAAEVSGRVGEEAAFTCTLRYRVRVVENRLVTQLAIPGLSLAEEGYSLISLRAFPPRINAFSESLKWHSSICFRTMAGCIPGASVPKSTFSGPQISTPKAIQLCRKTKAVSR